MGRFANDEIAFDVPGDWTGSMISAFRSPEMDAEISLTKFECFRGLPLDLSALILWQRLVAVHPGLDIVKKHIEPGKWLELVVEWTERETSMLAVVRAFVVGDDLWALAARSPKSSSDDIKDTVARTMASFVASD